MKRFWSFLFIVLFVLTSCTPTQGLALNSQYTVRHAIDSSVSIQMRFGPEWRIIGSGVAVRKHSALYLGQDDKFAVLTAEHVMKAQSVWTPLRACSVVKLEDCVTLGSYTSGNYRQPGSGNDWALAGVESLPKGIKPVRVRNRSLLLGEEVVTIGHPWGEFLIADAMCASKTRVDGAIVDRLIGYAAPGSSGGPVYDRRGKLVGIMVAIAVKPALLGHPEFQNPIVYMVPISNVEW